MTTALELADRTGVRAACTALAVKRPTYYGHRQPPRPRLPLTLSAAEEQTVLSVLHSERFVEVAPHEVYATLLDDQGYHCSTRTTYRVFERHNEFRERRRQRVRPAPVKPEPLATAPNQVWFWDITKLLGPAKWTSFYRYVLMEIFSRYVVGWLITERESASLARRLNAQSCVQQGIERGQLTVHSDRGPSMTLKLVPPLLADLGITKTHSRPYASDDYAFMEALFKTTKYCPEFPQRFDSLAHALTLGRVFFPRYDTVHRHSGVGFLTPEMVHYGQAPAVLHARVATLALAFGAHPTVSRAIGPNRRPCRGAVGINLPKNPPTGSGEKKPTS